ncbi:MULTISPECIES: lytic polysaccharide monooxygenase auxiliary activity family 9 protein [Actinoalloteichus]|uniref:Chitin binding domain n=1 Tax=Actinoalloteichus fjordicus TaxID=1612552 RepID=A0AAC9L8C5_9PSEU|nr:MULTISPECIES: lytic polysaccharide monooxygenase auxiliary activity family 9 protein [Actinoalloteichus]APU13278.1 Chitin binding domain [Actinoalloteichus fjordicus]APU19229.1 Chitin binding domain [Actinoalloteichus sp. GBA129-24]
MNPRTRDLAVPHSLAATAADRTDGELVLKGIQLEWTVGGNSGGDWPPPVDWNDGRAPYPHLYEVWLNGGAIKQTAVLFWADWAPSWQAARTHWVCLGTDPDPEYRVTIRARLADGTWSPFTDEVVVTTGDARAYSAVAPAVILVQAPVPAPDRHGSLDHPVSRAVLLVRKDDSAAARRRARELNTAAGQAVTPPATAMLADPPWNGSYLEYRKFFRGGDVASAGNPLYTGLDEAGERPRTILSAADAEHSFTYRRSAHHVDPTWTHQWFITRDDWNPEGAVSWDDLEPVPFMTEVHGDPGTTHHATEAVPEKKTGRHVIVTVWGGHGGPGLPDGRLAGEFFVSCSDVEFV